jgi:hypothetical protein
MNQLITKTLEELKDENNREKFNNNQFCRVRYDNSSHGQPIFSFADENRMFENLMMEEHKVTILLTAFSTLPYFTKTESKYYQNTINRHKNAIFAHSAWQVGYTSAESSLASNWKYLGEILSNTLTKHLTNPKWLEILNQSYLENVSL